MHPPDLVLFARQAKLFAQHLDLKKLLPVGEPFGVAEKMEMGNLAVAGQLPYSASLTGTLVYRGIGRGTARQLTWFTRTGAPVGTLGDIDRQSSGQLVLSRDGGYVVISRAVDGNADVWLMETARGVLRRLTTDGVYEGYPVLSPDGTQLLFNSYLKGKTDLYLKSIADVSAGVAAGNSCGKKSCGLVSGRTFHSVRRSQYPLGIATSGEKDTYCNRKSPSRILLPFFTGRAMGELRIH